MFLSVFMFMVVIVFVFVVVLLGGLGGIRIAHLVGLRVCFCLWLCL